MNVTQRSLRGKLAGRVLSPIRIGVKEGAPMALLIFLAMFLACCLEGLAADVHSTGQALINRRGLITTTFKTLRAEATIKWGTGEITVLKAGQSASMAEEVAFELQEGAMRIRVIEGLGRGTKPEVKSIDEGERQEIETTLSRVEKRRKIATRLPIIALLFPPKMGWLSITSIPSGGEVFINGSSEGITPLSALERAGKHKVRVALGGHSDWNGDIDVKNNQGTEIEARMNPLPRVTIRKVEGVLTTRLSVIGGEKVALAKLAGPGGKERQEPIAIEIGQEAVLKDRVVMEKKNVEEGRRVFVEFTVIEILQILSPPLQLEALRDEELKKIQNEAQSISRIAEKKDVGLLVVSSIPAGADLFLNGAREGVTPLSITKEAGDYEVKVVASGFPDWVGTVKLEKGRTVNIAAEILDTAPPVIHILAPSPEADEGTEVVIGAVVLDDKKVESVEIFYRTSGETSFNRALLPPAGDGSYYFTIPKEEVIPPGVDYYLKASDGTHISTSPISSLKSHRVSVRGAVGGISIASSVEGARVFLDSRFMGETPIVLREVKEGIHTLSLEKAGYGKWEGEVRVAKGETTRVKVDLNALPGVLFVTSNPLGARVYLSDKGAEKLVGTTPLNLTEFAPGKYRVRLEYQGYQDWTGDVSVAPEGIASVDAALSPKVGYITLSTDPPGAEVYVDERLLGASPVEKVETPIGSYVLKVLKDKHIPVERTIDVKEDQTVELNLILKEKAGAIYVDSRPVRSRFYLDGDYKGMTPISLPEVESGLHEVRLEPEDSRYKVLSRSLKVLPDGETRLEEDLQLRKGKLTLRINPPDAEVLLDGEKAASPIVAKEIVVGEHSIKVSKEDYRAVEFQVTVEEEMTVERDVSLSLLPASLSITSSPAQAAVFLNEAPSGQTPLTLEDLPVGRYRLRLSPVDPKYKDWAGDVVLRPGRKEAVGAVLEIRKGKLSVSAQPEGIGAKVFLDGRELGETPLSEVELAVGDYDLELVKAKFETAKQRISVQEGKTLQLRLTLNPLFGYLDLTSEPSGAQVYIDGRDAGHTPLVGLELPIGRHRLRLVKEKFVALEGQFHIVGGDVATLAFDLIPLKGYLTLKSTPPDSQIYLGSKLLGRTPLLKQEFEVGRYRLKIARDKYYETTVEVTIENATEAVVEVALAPLPGSIIVESQPKGAEVTLGSQRIGITPLTAKDLEPGRYHLRVAKDKYEAVEEEVSVESTAERRYSYRLRPLFGSLSVSSAPSGAEVVVDGAAVGLTPLTNYELPVGGHRLNLNLNKYEVLEEAVVIEGDRTLQKSYTLVYMYGPLAVESTPAEADVYLDGRLVGKTPLSLAEVRTGLHSVRFVKADYVEVEKDVVIEPTRGGYVEASLKFKPGSLVASSSPEGALVYLEGLYQGTTPFVLADLAPYQPYSLELVQRGYLRWREDNINLKPGEVREVKAELTKRVLFEPSLSIAGGPNFALPTSVVSDVDGNIYVADSGRHLVVKYSKDGRLLFKIGGTGAQASRRATDVGGEIPSDGSGSANGQFNLPRGLALDKNGNLYVSDSLNNRIQKFDRNGSFLMKFGKGGSGPGQFNKPAGIAIDPQGDIWVVDSENHRVQEFSADGRYLSSFGAVGSGSGQFNTPEGVAIDGNGNIYAVDWGNSRVFKFLPDGRLVTTLGAQGSGSGQLMFPTFVTTDDEGYVYVADTGNNRIGRFTPEGQFSFFIERSGGDRRFSGPQGIYVDRMGDLLVVEQDIRRVSRLKPKWDQDYTP